MSPAGIQSTAGDKPPPYSAFDMSLSAALVEGEEVEGARWAAA